MLDAGDWIVYVVPHLLNYKNEKLHVSYNNNIYISLNKKLIYSHAYLFVYYKQSCARR